MAARTKLAPKALRYSTVVDGFQTISGHRQRLAAVTLVNTSPLRERRLIAQAGAFGEHAFTDVTDLTADRPSALPVEGKHVTVVLPPARSTDLRLGMRRYVNQPSYAQPA